MSNVLAKAWVSCIRWIWQLWWWNDEFNRKQLVVWNWSYYIVCTYVKERKKKSESYSVSFDKWYLDSMWHIVKINFLLLIKSTTLHFFFFILIDTYLTWDIRLMYICEEIFFFLSRMKLCDWNVRWHHFQFTQSQ
jgi:hypothetical protein